MFVELFAEFIFKEGTDRLEFADCSEPPILHQRDPWPNVALVEVKYDHKVGSTCTVSSTKQRVCWQPLLGGVPMGCNR